MCSTHLPLASAVDAQPHSIVNGILTSIGLWLLGVPLALTLGLIAGVLNFVPNLGPIVASVPAILIAWLQSRTQAIYVAILYLALQSLDRP